MTEPIHIRADAPRLQTRDDPRFGRAAFRLLVDASGGPSAGLVQGTLHLERGDAEQLHAHPEHAETIHVIEGEAVASFKGRRIPLLTGDTVFVPKGALHALAAPETDATLLFTFAADRLDEVKTDFAEPD